MFARKGFIVSGYGLKEWKKRHEEVGDLQQGKNNRVDRRTGFSFQLRSSQGHVIKLSMEGSVLSMESARDSLSPSAFQKKDK